MTTRSIFLSALALCAACRGPTTANVEITSVRDDATSTISMAVCRAELPDCTSALNLFDEGEVEGTFGVFLDEDLDQLRLQFDHPLCDQLDLDLIENPVGVRLDFDGDTLSHSCDPVAACSEMLVSCDDIRP